MNTLLERRRAFLSSGINWNNLAVQTLDSTKDNYNPAVAIILQQNNVGTTLPNPINPDEGRYYLTKSQAAAISTISSWFYGATSVTDTNAIVTSDNTATYNFESFDELEHFIGITSWEQGNSATFRGCSLLKRVTIPKSLSNRQYTFNGCTSLEQIKFLIPHTSGDYRYTYCTALKKIYFNTLDDFLNSWFGTFNTNTNKQGPFDASSEGHVYINNVELTSIAFPYGTTSIPRCSFLVSLENVSVPETVTSLPAHCFRGCSSIKNIEILNENATTGVGTSFSLIVGDGTGVFILKCNYSGNTSAGAHWRFKKILFYKNYNWTGAWGCNLGSTEVFRIKNDIQYTYSSTQSGAFGSFPTFLECYDIVAPNKSIAYNNSGNGTYLHICKNDIPTATPAYCAVTKFPTIFVGDGSSRTNDETVLTTYTTDTNWSSYSSRLATWWDYNGQYKWYYVTDNLTNCTSSNPVTWPYITRNESYHTVITVNEGYTLSSVTVQMYEAVDDGVTPSTPTDITSTAYDPNTGEINIEHVTGNVIITAVAVI